MFAWFKKRPGSAPAALKGAPPVRRVKSYSAQSGYVYQYVYDGHREASRDSEAGTEYVFQVSADRKTSFAATVFLGEAARRRWESGHRELAGTERYAIAKLALFQAFDERESPRAMRELVRVRAADVEAILERLGLD